MFGEILPAVCSKEEMQDVKIFDLRGISPLCDFTVIATVDVARQANACIEHLGDGEKIKKLYVKYVLKRIHILHVV